MQGCCRKCCCYQLDVRYRNGDEVDEDNGEEDEKEEEVEKGEGDEHEEDVDLEVTEVL